MRLASSVTVAIEGTTILVVAPGRLEIERLQARLKETPGLAERLRIASPETIRAFLVARRHTALTHYAVNRLARALPRLSVRGLLEEDRIRGAKTLLAACLGMSLVAPGPTLTVLGIVSTLFFCNCCLWKSVAAFHRPRPLRLEAVPTARLPTYTVLVPLFREAVIVPDLVASSRSSTTRRPSCRSC